MIYGTPLLSYSYTSLGESLFVFQLKLKNLFKFLLILWLLQEVHYNQHGLLLLEGQGIYRLGDSW